MPINVLLVDDSVLVRKMVKDIIERDPVIKVVGQANNGGSAIFKNNELNPDVIVLDIEMPLLDGLSCLVTIMESNPKPVVMLSALTSAGAEATLKSLELGAVDFVAKPKARDSLDQIFEELVSKIKLAAQAHVKPMRYTDFAASRSSKILDFEKGTKRMAEQIVALGVSTGGPSALVRVFGGFPEKFPAAVLVAQHMPEGFTRSLAAHLNRISALNVKEAEDGDVPFAGCAYIAPGDRNLVLDRKAGGGYVLRVAKTDKVKGCRPSADVLFSSVSKAVGREALGVIMTGMGNDGADGIKLIHDLGGYTMAQDRGSSVIYGMNRVAVEMGVIDEIVQLDEIAKKIVEYIDGINDYRNKLIINGIKQHCLTRVLEN
ncbi:MAG: chemotaxis response regulator protein-glutamate methylesterase [Leptospirales bacterium]|nr:chemotaxis response regulator protein-glutamate methylesterase [Leptospirales bacterium]